MSSSQYEWKVLAIGHGQQHAERAQEYINSLGYKNVVALSIDNNQENDDRLLNTLKQKDSDAVAIGGYINIYNFEKYCKIPYSSDDFSKEREEVFYWFNRLINLIHENFPKLKFILAKSPEDIGNGIERILGKHQEQQK